MKPVVGRQRRARELLAHGLRLRRREAKRLEIREAPVSLAEIRRPFDALEIGVDALGVVAGGLERVPQAHPHLGLVRIVREHASVLLDGRRVLADAPEDRGLEIAIAGIARLVGEQPLHLRERGFRLVLPVQHHGVVVARGRESRREFEATRQQVFRVGDSARCAPRLRPACGSRRRPWDGASGVRAARLPLRECGFPPAPAPRP